jgi:hypothetical protein
MKMRQIEVLYDSAMATTVRVQALAIRQIKLNRRNSRTHSAKQIRQIANSIVAFGFTNPLLVTEDGTLIAGEGRYKAAQLLGLATVPVVVLAGLRRRDFAPLRLPTTRLRKTRAGTVSALRSKSRSWPDCWKQKASMSRSSASRRSRSISL